MANAASLYSPGSNLNAPLVVGGETSGLRFLKQTANLEPDRDAPIEVM